MHRSVKRDLPCARRHFELLSLFVLIALGARIEKVQADKLPLNGRNWALTALMPGAIDTGAAISARFASRSNVR